MKLVLASRNQKKIAELRTLLREFFPDAEVLSLDDIGYAGDIEENGTTFEENAMIKAQYIAIANTGEHHSIYATDLEEAIKIFRSRNIRGKCKQIGTDIWIKI